MNQNCTYCTNGVNAKTNPKLSVRLSGIVYDERVAYIESVCSALIESRFGPGRSGPVVVHLSDRPELEEAVFYDVTAAGPVPCYSILPDSEMARRYMADAILRELKGPKPVSVSIHIQNDSPQALGRGSP